MSNFPQKLEDTPDEQLKQGINQQGKLNYFHLHWPRGEEFFVKGPKILSVRKCTSPTFAYTENEAYVMMSFNIIRSSRVNLKYLTGLLNSTLIKYWLKYKGKMQGSNFQIDKEPLLNIPIFKPDEAEQERVANLVDSVIKLYGEYRNTSANIDKWHLLKAEIEKLENEIDQEVYKLYSLTLEEIKVIEKSI